jgi:type I restriction enzyme M protein
MPSNIFATTNTNVSTIFIDKSNKDGKIILMDASKLGETVKEGKNQKTLLTKEEEHLIVDTFDKVEAKEDFSVVVSYEQIKEKNYNFSAGQFFDIKSDHKILSKKDFKETINTYNVNLLNHFNVSNNLQNNILENLKKLNNEH